MRRLNYWTVIGLLILLISCMFMTATALAADKSGGTNADTGHITMMAPPLQGHKIEVTSPWGDPNHGANGHMHLGVDIAGEYSEPVYAVADGTVKIATTDPSHGFNGWVVIDHGGWETWYGDLDCYNGVEVSVNDHVKAGQRIGHLAEAGVTQLCYSTGPHLHFEVRVNGTSIRPAIYGPYAPWLPDNADVAGVGRGQNHKFIWNAAYNFTEPIHKAVDTIAKACTDGLDLLKGTIKYIIGLLMTIDLALTYILLSVDSEHTRSPQYSVFKVLALRMILYLLLFFFIAQWGPYIANASRDLFLGLGAMTSGVDADAASKAVADPMALVTKGAKIIEPIFTVLNETDAGRGEWLEKVASGVTAIVFLIIIFGTFILFAFQIALAYLEFYVTMMFSFTTFVFAGLKQTRQYAGYGMNAIFSVSIKLFFFCFFSVMLQAVMSNIVVGDLVVESQEEYKITGGAMGQPTLEEFADAIREAESGGDPFVYNQQGSGAFGLYQQMPQYWNGRCQEYAEAHGIDPEAYKVKSWQNCPDDVSYPTSKEAGDYGWNPEVQDEVSRYEMENFYKEGHGEFPPGDLRAVADGWNPGGGEWYYEYVMSKLGSTTRKRHVLEIMTLIKLAVVCIMFLFMADKLSRLIITQFGGKNGFKFTNNV